MTLLALQAEADAAWHTYGETVLFGGTPEERRWRFDKALRAEAKLQEREAMERELRHAKVA
jgi:hypothetical protein